MLDTKHLLLMLSTSQPPHPVEEIAWHAEVCHRTGNSTFVTTQVVSGLTRGESIIAFYGDSTLSNRYLGRGVFAGAAKINDPRGKELLARSPLYANGNLPGAAKTVIEVTDVRIANEDEKL